MTLSRLITQIKIPKLSLIILIGASGSGKSSFAKKHFKATEILIVSGMEQSGFPET